MKCPGRRRAVLGILLLCGGSIVVAGYQAPGGGRQGRGGDGDQVIQVDKLKDNLFVLRGGGGNTAVFVGSDGVTVVDTKIPGWGEPLIAKIKELTAKPVIRIKPASRSTRRQAATSSPRSSRAIGRRSRTASRTTSRSYTAN